MKNQVFQLKGQFLFLLGLTIPAALINSINPAYAGTSSPTVVRQNKPFIDSTSRYDSLRVLQVKPSGGFNQQDGTGKESSDDKKKESKDGKEQSEGGLIPRAQERINPAIFKYRGRNIHSQLPNQLLTSQQPII